MERIWRSKGLQYAAAFAALMGLSAAADTAGPAKPKPAAWLGVAIADVPPAEIPAAYAPVTPEGAVRIQQVFKGTSAD